MVRHKKKNHTKIPQKTSFDQNESIDQVEYKDIESEVVLDDSDILPVLREEEAYDNESNAVDAEVEEDDFDELQSDHSGLAVSTPLSRYLAELRRYPLMTREEEHAAAVEAFEHDDVAARNRLVTANLRLVVKIAMEYRRAYLQILDLIQEGNAGLLQAVKRFNPYRNVKLSTYSAWWIRAYILKFLMDNKSLVRMGTTDAQRKLFFRLRSEAEKMYALTQKFDANLLAEKIGVQAEDVIEMQQRLSKHDASLDTPVRDGSSMSYLDALVSDREDPETLLERQELLQILRKEIHVIEKGLNDRDQYIFHHRIMADEPVTLQEIGDKYGITRERARQIEANLMKKIRDRLIAAGIKR